MHCEIPDFRRCCVFIPLRYGILTFGYLNLVFTILNIAFEIWLDWGHNPLLTVTVADYRGVSMYAQMWLPYLLYVLEVAFDMVLLVGCHMKRPLLIRVYYYYGIVTTVATLLIFVVLRFNHGEQSLYMAMLEYCLAFSGFVLQVYLLMLIRTELRKLVDQQKGLSYENHLTEVVLDPPPFGNGRNLL